MYRSFTINAQFLIKNRGSLFILLIIFAKFPRCYCSKKLFSPLPLTFSRNVWNQKSAGVAWESFGVPTFVNTHAHARATIVLPELVALVILISGPLAYKPLECAKTMKRTRARSLYWYSPACTHSSCTLHFCVRFRAT